MKKSLIIRWVIIALVLLIWIWAMLPLKDKDYLKTFDKLAAPNVEKLHAGRDALLKMGNPEEISEKMRATKDRRAPSTRNWPRNWRRFRPMPISMPGARPGTMTNWLPASPSSR